MNSSFRETARAWLRANLPREFPDFASRVSFEQDLFRAGWAVINWPVTYGGRGASVEQWLEFEEEYWAAGGPPRVTQNGIYLLAPALFELGTDEQKQRL